MASEIRIRFQARRGRLRLLFKVKMFDLRFQEAAGNPRHGLKIPAAGHRSNPLNLSMVIGNELEMGANAREHSIPEPVTGGLLVSIAISVAYVLSGVEVGFDLAARAVLLALQLALAVLFAILICFRSLGRTYAAAVVSGGFMGIAMGATPTAMANITAITQRYGPSHLAFLIVPLVGAFFIDIANALIIKFFLGIL